MNKLEISVLITTYNCGEYITQSIKSILNQTYKDFELLIIDDGSTDNTEKIISGFYDERIRYIKLPHAGRSKALNYGLKVAKSGWVALMDADDISHSVRLERQVEHIVKGNNFIISTWSAYFVKNKILYTVETPQFGPEVKRKLALHSYICNSSVLFNKNFILASGGYNENLERFEDYELWLRIKDKAEFVVIPGYFQFVRVRKDSSSNFNKIETRKIIYGIQETYYRDFHSNFLNYSKFEELAVRGWREFFYGDKIKARSQWEKLFFAKPSIKIFLAYLLTFLPTFYLNSVRELRFKLRLKYILKKIMTLNELPLQNG